MLYSLPVTLAILCPLIFIAMFIDSIAGGGGIITIPAYLFVGLPITTAYGTNKLVAFTGTTFAAGNYIRSKCVNWTVAIPSLCGSLIGSFLGAELTLHLSTQVLQITLMVVLPIVGLIMIFNRGFGNNEQKKMHSFKTTIILGFLIGLVIGCYDGFFGPGTGMFLSLAFVLIERLNLVYATGTTKIANWASNLSAMVAYMHAGTIEYKVVIPCMICAVAGCILGSQCAIKKGTKFIKPIMVVVACLLMIKVVMGFFGK